METLTTGTSFMRMLKRERERERERERVFFQMKMNFLEQS